jgi:hypothetical protein
MDENKPIVQVQHDKGTHTNEDQVFLCVKCFLKNLNSLSDHLSSHKVYDGDHGDHDHRVLNHDGLL